MCGIWYGKVVATGGSKNEAWKDVYYTHWPQRCHAGDSVTGEGSDFGQVAEDSSERKSVSWGFEGKTRQGWVSCLGLACLNNSSGVWAIGV